jgi:1L-myo-inositol 1-phosphate cytidylyltransferase
MSEEDGGGKTSSISDAVILMAGSGSRLRAGRAKSIKPLISVFGRPLISYTVEALANAGITTVYAVVGFEHESLIAQMQSLVPHDVDVRFIENRDWQKQNGISALAAANYVSAPFLLTMSDHLFDQVMVDLLIRRAVLDQLNLAIDRKLDSIFDLEDAMKVQTRGDRIVAIGKQLQDYDAIDTGLFVCPATFFDYLERAKHGGDCSLADGVGLMATDGNACAMDIGDAWWQDVDTPEMLANAEKQLRSRRGHAAMANTGSEGGDSAEN